MGFRFRRSITLFPGVRINLSKSGVSTSIGAPGATLNVGSKRGARVTVGIPGSGLSYSEKLPTVAGRDAAGQKTGIGALLGWGVAVLIVAVVLFGLFAG